MAQDRAYMRGTAGGGAIYKTTDPVIETILKIIDWKTVVGLENQFDSDNALDTPVLLFKLIVL